MLLRYETSLHTEPYKGRHLSFSGLYSKLTDPFHQVRSHLALVESGLNSLALWGWGAVELNERITLA